MRLHLGSKQFTQHGRVTRILYVLIKIVLGEIKEYYQAGESGTLGLGFATFDELVQEVQDVING